MPAIKSSSKTGTTIILYRPEKRDIEDVRALALWLADNYPRVKVEAEAVVKSLGDLADKLAPEN